MRQRPGPGGSRGWRTQSVQQPCCKIDVASLDRLLCGYQHGQHGDVLSPDGVDEPPRHLLTAAFDRFRKYHVIAHSNVCADTVQPCHGLQVAPLRGVAHSSMRASTDVGPKTVQPLRKLCLTKATHAPKSCVAIPGHVHRDPFCHHRPSFFPTPLTAQSGKKRHEGRDGIHINGARPTDRPSLGVQVPWACYRHCSRLSTVTICVQCTCMGTEGVWNAWGLGRETHRHKWKESMWCRGVERRAGEGRGYGGGACVQCHMWKSSHLLLGTATSPNFPGSSMKTS